MRRVTEAAHAVQHCGCEQLAGGEYKLVRGEQRGGIAQQRCRFGAWAGQVAQQRSSGIRANPTAQQRGVGAAAASHGRVKLRSRAASVPLLRRERGSSAWAGQAAQQHSVGAAAAPRARQRRMGGSGGAAHTV